jgi:hypothetical protein
VRARGIFTQQMSLNWWLENKARDIDDLDDDDPACPTEMEVVARYQAEREALLAKTYSQAVIEMADFKDCFGFGFATCLARDINSPSRLFKEVIRLHADKKIRAPQAVALLEAGSAKMFRNRPFDIARLLDKPMSGHPYAGIFVLADKDTVERVWPGVSSP